MDLTEILTRWRGGLIVSCQAPPESPLSRPDIIAALALAAERNGAVGVRIEGRPNIAAVKGVVTVPVLGIEKLKQDGSDVYITPTCESAARVAAAGADVLALDGTARARPRGETLGFVAARVREEFGLPLMADVATMSEGLAAAEEVGVDFVSTTLSGYTAETAGRDGADFELVERLASRLRVPVVCEGRLRCPDDVRRAFDCGAFAVVVGTAITGVDHLVREFLAATPQACARV